MRCKNGQTYTAWTDLYNQQIQRHQKNRFFGTEQEALMFTNPINYIARDTISTYYESCPEDPSFLVLKKVVKTKLMEDGYTFSSFDMILAFKTRKKIVHQYYKNLN